ncbi:translation initiation factor IF-2 subunit alpha [Nanoarchaeota archaeon]|nr:MAG: translation initiation factor IF-2 subunit alpha [Nanoarchaeota archaeon]
MIKKKGLPRKGEIVICTVKHVGPHSAFVTLDEYENVEAMLHISEVASGRIKNIRDYITPGKQVVCLVLRVDERKGYVDVSLKRVTDSEKRRKFLEWRFSKRMGNLLRFLSKKLGESSEEVERKILERYNSLGDFFRNVQRKGPQLVDSLEISEKWKKALKEEFSEALKRKKSVIKAILELKSYAPDGVEKIRKIFKELGGDGVEITYLGAPRYQLKIIAENYKMAESMLSEIMNKLERLSKTERVEFRLER